MTETVGQPDERIDQLELIHAEVEAQLQSYAQRFQSMQSRAGVLVAGASIGGSLASSTSLNWATIMAIVFAFAAAVLGALALLPMRSASMDLWNIRQRVYGMTKGGGLLWLIDHKINQLNANEVRVTNGAVLLRFGFATFAASVLFILISALLTLTA
ncbi:hypothetical protein EDM22_12335 [Agromyces tardus]|uniref:Uncharacterized protein n=1 Tax=Agromyces tardus TaxID=2583849 RepID=A0A3M8A8H9_9MICO|nr:hypothetical protein [Agromyces tardus]RNB47412.1 hypothetical protein EDM22_12335 [Agromyces tardus]